MSIEACPLRVRARCGGAIVAESTTALREEPPEGGALLWFPRGDLRSDGLEGTGGIAVSGTGALSGHVRFDHDRVEQELVDDMGSAADRDVTVKRFPNWGDLTDLRRLLDVVPAGDGRWIGPARDDQRRPVVEGSQLLAQALVAAARHAPGRRVVSASMVFARTANTREEVTIELGDLADGRTFTGLTPRLSQSGRTCAAGTLLLDVTAPDLVRHQVAPPDVPGPYESEPLDLSITGRDIRIVDDAYTLASAAPVGPPQLDAWLRFREAPDDQALHVALLTHITGFFSLAAALRPHAGIGLDQAHRTISTGVNAISLAIHREVKADQWMLYRHLSTYAGDGMTHSEGRVHDQDGHLLASFTVDAMLRGLSSDVAPTERRAAL